MNATSSTNTTAPQDSLSSRLQALPQELVDIIQDLTFTAGPSHVCIRAGSANLFPKLLHVSRATQEHFASSHYSQTLFHIVNLRLLDEWVETLDRKHWQIIHERGHDFQGS